MAADTERPQTHNSLRTYYIVYAALLGLLTLTVVVALLDVGAAWGLTIALTIAVAKSLLVMLYFMHVRDSSRTTWLFAAAGFAWLLILFVLMMGDYLSRGWLTE